MDEKENTINLGDIFRIDPENIKADIKCVHYSNVAYVQVNQRDVQIDFMQMPGITGENGTEVETNRIFLSHSAAKKLSETIIQTLEKAKESGKLDLYE